VYSLPLALSVTFKCHSW